MSEMWFQVQDAETGAERAPARELLKDALEDKRKLPEGVRRDCKIGRVKAKPGRGSLPEMARGAR